MRKGLKFSDVYPYLVTSGYPERTPGTYRSIGHGIRVALVQDLGDRVESVSADELAAEGLSWDDGYRRALQNLEAMVRAGAVGSNMFPNGPQGRAFILFGGHWAASSCILLPSLHEVAEKALQTNELVASIPHRGALLVFAKGDRSYRDAMRAMIREKEANEPKPLTPDLFEIAREGLGPLVEDRWP